jgi:CheY-like chemotaxis protein
MTENERAVLKAYVEDIRASGALVSLSNGQRAWLPAEELYADYNPHSIKFRDRARDLKGKEITVVVYAIAFPREILVSHIRVGNDPWKIVATWRDGDIKIIDVFVKTKKRAIGIIKPGIRACIRFCERSLLPPSWNSFDVPLPGDEIAGYFHKKQIDESHRMVELDYAGYIQSNVSLTDILTEPVDSETFSINKLSLDVSETEKSRREVGTFNRILIVDDDKPFLDALGCYMTDLGCQVFACLTEEETLTVLAGEESLDLALIDIHMNKDAGDYLGLSIASRIAANQPACRIVIVSADMLASSTAIQSFENVPVSGMIIKPFGINELFNALALSTQERPKSLREHLSPISMNYSIGNQVIANFTQNDEINETCYSLQKGIGAEAIVLFLIDPVSEKVAIISISDPHQLFFLNNRKLSHSPVRDVAIENEEIFTKHASSHSDQPKHRWLLNAIKYESCIGIPVIIGYRSPTAHALFAFHRKAEYFTPYDYHAVKQTAQTIGHILKSKFLIDELRQMKPFELMGKIYGSMAHDLGSVLPDEFLFEKLEKEINRGNIKAASQMASALRTRSMRAKNIVHTFRSMARGQQDQVEQFKAEDVVAAATMIFESDAKAIGVKCHMIPYNGSPCVVNMRKSGLEQIIYNLLLNAAQQIDRLRYLRQSEGEIRVEIQHQIDIQRDKWAIILVHDNGPGIHRCDFDRIYDMHFTTKENGCGMGLDICRTIAQSVVKNGRIGSLRVRRSILLAGTTFELRLPLQENE